MGLGAWSKGLVVQSDEYLVFIPRTAPSHSCQEQVRKPWVEVRVGKKVRVGIGVGLGPISVALCVFVKTASEISTSPSHRDAKASSIEHGVIIGSG